MYQGLFFSRFLYQAVLNGRLSKRVKESPFLAPIASFASGSIVLCNNSIVYNYYNSIYIIIIIYILIVQSR